MLKSEGLYSNFWHGWTEDYYYLRTEDYKPILYCEKTGYFVVPMVHSCVLINLRHVKSDFLTYVPENVKEFDGPQDNIITFVISANKNGIRMHLCNENKYGFITVPLQQDDDLKLDKELMVNVKLAAVNEIEDEPLKVNALLSPYVQLPKKDTMGFDKIYMINLVRRPERRKRMFILFDELGLDVTTVDAVDGR